MRITTHTAPYSIARRAHTRGALLWLMVMACIAGASCKKGFSSDQFVDDKIVVLAEISAADSIRVPIGKTIKAGGGNIIRFEKVNDATVVLTEKGASSVVLQPNFAPQFAANPTSVFSTRRRFKSNTTYTILINHPTLGVVSATTLIPTYPRLTAIDTSSQIYQGKNLLAADITWQDTQDKTEYYVIEALKELLRISHHFFHNGVRYEYETDKGKTLYEQVKNTPGFRLYTDTASINKFVRLGLYTQDQNTENSRIDNLANSFRRIFLHDNSFNGQSNTTRVFIDPQFFKATDPTQKGRVRLQLKSVSKELFDYFMLYEKYKTDFGSVPATQLTSPDGNIANGIGIFGGSARREKWMYFDELK